MGYFIDDEFRERVRKSYIEHYGDDEDFLDDDEFYEDVATGMGFTPSNIGDFFAWHDAGRPLEEEDEEEIEGVEFGLDEADYFDGEEEDW